MIKGPWNTVYIISKAKKIKISSNNSFNEKETIEILYFSIPLKAKIGRVIRIFYAFRRKNDDSLEFIQKQRTNFLNIREIT
jgi:hypothetical protein